MHLSPRAVKLIGKGALMIAGSAVIGTVVKAEERLKDRIDEHYESQKDENTDDPDA